MYIFIRTHSEVRNSKFSVNKIIHLLSLPRLLLLPRHLQFSKPLRQISSYKSKPNQFSKYYEKGNYVQKISCSE